MIEKKKLFGVLAVSVILVILVGFYLNSPVSVPYEVNESYLEEVPKTVLEKEVHERSLTYSSTTGRGELDGTIVIEEYIVNTDHTAGWFTLWVSTRSCGQMSDNIYLNPGEQGKAIVNSHDFAPNTYCSVTDYGVRSEFKTVTDEYNVTVYENVTKYRIVTKYRDVKRYQALFG